MGAPPPPACAQTQAELRGRSDPSVLEIADRYGISDLDLDRLLSIRAARTEAAAGPLQLLDLDRYQDLGVVARGGMGMLHRLHDRTLDRTLAMKVLRPRFSANPIALARFREEARIAANLVHPGVVPVIDIRRTETGKVAILMPLIEGERLDHAIQTAHDGPGPPATRQIRALVDAVVQLSEVVAYAHARRVPHRDIKGANVLVRWDAAETRVWLIDWGLSSMRHAPDPHTPTPRALHPDYTLTGTICGTPRTMSPEAALASGPLDGRADVYSIGVCLFEVLAGINPWAHIADADLVDHLCAEPDPPRPPELLTPGLADICQRAMNPNPDRRYPDAGALVQALHRWTQRADNWSHAAAHVARADDLQATDRALDARTSTLEMAVAHLEAGIPGWAPSAQKRPLWALEDQLDAIRRQRRQVQDDQHAALQAAIALVPEFPDAIERLADRARRLHEEAERRCDRDAARQNEALLGVYDRGAHSAYLDGAGSLSLTFTRPVRVTVRRWATHDRQLVPGPVAWTGPAPLHNVKLARGRYLIEIDPGDGVTPVRYPIEIRRNERCQAIPPGETTPRPLWVPEPGDIGPEEVLVPAGWTWFGDADAPGGLPRRRLWVEGFIVGRYPVTLGEYLEFLQAIAAEGRLEEAFRLAPRNRNTGDGPDGMEIGWTEQRGFFLKEDADGEQWHPRWPVVMCGWEGAEAFARWRSRARGQPLRLPSEPEWERSARGGDDRIYPWGDHGDPSFALTHGSTPEGVKPSLLPVNAFPTDRSPFDVACLAGHAMDWCASPGRPEGPHIDALGRWREAPPMGDQRAVRGGAWGRELNRMRVGARAFAGRSRSALIGFRLVRSLPLG